MGEPQTSRRNCAGDGPSAVQVFLHLAYEHPRPSDDSIEDAWVESGRASQLPPQLRGAAGCSEPVSCQRGPRRRWLPALLLAAWSFPTDPRAAHQTARPRAALVDVTGGRTVKRRTCVDDIYLGPEESSNPRDPCRFVSLLPSAGSWNISASCSDDSCCNTRTRDRTHADLLIVSLPPARRTRCLAP